jgi:hypothetical protein
MRARVLLMAGTAMLMAAACATTPPAPPSVNLTGKWAGNWSYEPSNLGAGTLSGTFVQEGAKLSGNFLIVGGGSMVRHPAALVIGFVSGNQVTLSQPGSGTLTVNAEGTEMSGWVNGLDQARLTLHKQP